MQSGAITNINSFDREERDLYQLSVVAMDNAPIPRFSYTSVSPLETFTITNCCLNVCRSTSGYWMIMTMLLSSELIPTLSQYLKAQLPILSYSLLLLVIVI